MTFPRCHRSRLAVFTTSIGLAMTLVLTNCSGAPPVSKNATVSIQANSVQAAQSDSLNASRATLLDSGAVYFKSCAICHSGNGKGGRGPTLANSDYVQKDRARLIRTVLAGIKEPIHVNGVRWKTGEMLGWADTYNDFKIAAVLTYIRATLNDSNVVSCEPEDMEKGTWASCEMTPRAAEDIAADSVAVHEVAAMRAALGR